MKKVNVLAAASAVVLGLAATSCDSKQNVSLSNDVDSVSYAIGVSTGAGYKENLKTLPGGEANVDALIAGFVEAIKGDSTKMTPEKAREYMQTYLFRHLQKKLRKTKKKVKNSWLKTRQKVVLSQLKAVCNTKSSQKEQVLNRQKRIV